MAMNKVCGSLKTALYLVQFSPTYLIGIRLNSLSFDTQLFFDICMYSCTRPMSNLGIHKQTVSHSVEKGNSIFFLFGIESSKEGGSKRVPNN